MPFSKNAPSILRFRHWLRMLCVLAVALSIVSPPERAAAIEDDSEIQFEVGFHGQAKLGCWQPFLITTPDRMEPARFELTVFDGDDTPITYAGELHSIGSSLNQHQGYVMLGRGYGSAKLVLLDRTGTPIATRKISLGQTSSFTLLQSTQPMILVLEPNDKLTRTIESTSVFNGRETESVFINVNSSESLPLDWFCYEGIDTVFLVTSDIERIKKISVPQWQALARWITDGGRLVISAAANSEALFADSGPLSVFSPGRYSGLSKITESDRLETYAKKGQLIERDGEPLSVASFTDVSGQTYSQDGQPLIIRSAKGFGEIVFVTFDLDDPRITGWSGYSNLVHRLQSDIDAQETERSQTNNTRGGSVSHYGYEDLIGQLRVPLDRFNGVHFLDFAWIALLIGLYILCIGPGDYFFLRKLTGKMELTWITFPVLSLLFCGLAVWIATATRPGEIQLNQLEIVDIDAESKHVRGSIWSNLYSPSAGEYRISLDRNNALGFETESDLLSWQGLPGSGLGGMQTKSSPGISRAGYQHLIESTSPDNRGGSHSVLNNVPLYVSATKPLFGHYNAIYPGNIRSNLQLPTRTGRLDGTLVNPLNVPLKKCRND